MATIKVQTNVTGNIEPHVVYELNQPITLLGDGSGGRQSIDNIQVNDGILNIQFVGHGLMGTDWTLKVTQLAPTPGTLFDVPGTIGPAGLAFYTNGKKIA
jgi:hypothetical protein